MNLSQAHDASVIVGELIQLDLRQFRRQAMSYVLIGTVVVIPIGFLVTLGTFYFMVSANVPFHGVSNPKFGLGGYEPSLFYLCVLTSLLLCLRLPSYRGESLENTVLTYRSPSNFLLVLSRVLAPSILVCGSLVIAFLVYQIFAVIDVAIQPKYVEPLEPWSLVFVLVNLSVAVIFWTSLGTLVSQVFSSRTIGFIGTSVMLLIQAFISPMLPGNLGSFTFGYGAMNLYVSDIAPDYWGFTHLIYWFSVVCLSLATIFVTSFIQPRTDPDKRSTYKPFAAVLAFVGVVCQLVVHTHTSLTISNHQLWAQAYETSSQTLLELPSVRAIEGTVRIEPGSMLQFDLSYTVEVPTFVFSHKGSSNTPTIPLALNPGMKVSSLTCSNIELEYLHQHGIVEIDLGSCEPSDDNMYALNMRAEGKPDPYYLAYRADITRDDGRSLRLARLLGERTSVFTTQYVALTPTSHWYPQVLHEYSPLPNADTRNRIDVSLTLELDQRSWTVVTVGGQVFTPEDFDAERNVLSGKFRSLGLLASDFHQEKHSFEEVDVNLLAHRQHAERLEQNALLTDSLVQYVSETLAMLQEKGINYPFDQFSIVEIPAQLSWLNERRGVNTGLDSILMFREAGLPFARIHRLADTLEKSNSEDMAWLREQMEYELIDYWTNPFFGQTYEDVIIAAVLSNETYSEEPFSAVTKSMLEIFLLDLLGSDKILTNYTYRFDLDIARELADESRVNLRLMQARTYMYTPFNLRLFRDDFLSSNEFWESIERSFHAAEELGGQDPLQMSIDQRRQKRFRLFQLAELIAASYDDQEIANALASILATPGSETIDLPLVVQTAKTNGVDVAQILTDFLFQDKLAGVHFASAKQARIEDAGDNDPQFVTVIDFRNGEDVSAHVMFDLTEIEEVEYGEETLRVVAAYDTYGPFQLTGETSYRFRIKTKNQIGTLEANTFLSLNRGKVQIPITDVQSLSADPSLETYDQTFSIATSEWNPLENENEIIVDDLDPGFEVLNVNPSSERSWWRIEVGWFRSIFPNREELENGIPTTSYRATHVGSWTRSTSGSGWGRYRASYVFVPSSLRPVRKVSFNAELSRAGRWVLSYHFPNVQWSGDYNIEVIASQQNWDLILESQDRKVGWQEIGVFDVEFPGNTKVLVSNESNAEYVFADAIKWTYTE